MSKVAPVPNLNQHILIAGGNSGIGLRTAQLLAGQGHRLLLLGRDVTKGERAVGSIRDAGGAATFLPVDLSTHDGVRAAAKDVLAVEDSLDAVVHTTGVFTSKEMRTSDGLHPFFAVNYLSRYHLTQLLLALQANEQPRVLMMTAKVDPTTDVDMAQFPAYQPFNLSVMRKPIQVANRHYAAHLSASGVQAGVVNAGAVKTDIMRSMPWYMKAAATVLGPVVFDSVDTGAHNVVQALSSSDWHDPTYWPKPGDYNKRMPIEVNPSLTRQLMARSESLTSA